MTKAELISHISQLEQQTVQAKLNNFSSELKLLGVDALKLVGAVYNAGHYTGRYFYSTLPAIKGLFTNS